ncbi:MAG TPA: transketolase [Acidimicrobiia bacterium]|nr:transketolase [Acidimicrobiia bacterium]
MSGTLADMSSLEQLAVNTIKGLTMDAVQKANSGHPGMPMGMADIAVTLWSRFLVVDPESPQWVDRDRFVLSNGHGSMLLYSLLHLSGFPLGMDQLQSFRQWGSHTAGHPEIDQAVGIETTTGPLGQGFGTGVGLAIAEEHLRARLGADLISHRTYGFVSDGDLQEGISAEAASIAGHLGLGRLTYYYDDNQISIDGDTDKTFTEDVGARFRSLGWHVVDIDGHDREAVAAATEEAHETEDRPSLIVCHTEIAKGAPTKAGTAASHGSPLGEDEILAVKEAMEFPVGETFHVPEGVYEWFSEAMNRGREAHAAWERRHADAMHDELTASTWGSFFGADPVTLEDPGFEVGEALATRASSGKLFSQIAEKAQNFIGGSADLVESTKTLIDHDGIFSVTDRASRDIAFGIREHAMGAIVNGMAIHGGLRPYGATFFVFSDYMRPAVRLAALMSAPSIFVWTHDSVFLGEDGPTHQPIEHLASLRAMPNLDLIRPADAGEVLEAWELALNRTDGPTGLVLTRQNVPTLDRPVGGVARGGYVLRDGSDVVLVATGSEVSVALDAAEDLAGRGVSARVVSLPSWFRFFDQPADYRTEVLGEGIPRVSVEAGATFGWERIVGADGLMIGVDHFGASAPAGVIAEKLGLTAAAVADRVAAWLP